MLPQENFWRSKNLYTNLIIIVLYIILGGFAVYVLFAPRNYQIIDGIVSVDPLFTSEQLIWIGIGLMFFFLGFFGIAERNGKLVMQEFAHMDVIKGPFQLSKKSGEMLDLWIEKITPFAEIPKNEREDYIMFLVRAGANLKNFDNYEKVQKLLEGAEKRKQIEYNEIFDESKTEDDDIIDV